jgi:lysophospholipase
MKAAPLINAAPGLTPAPLHNDLAEGPDGGAAFWITTPDDVRIRIAVWPLEGAKGCVVLMPGRTEYVEKYGRAAQDLRARGYATVAIDWRGQGLADRALADAMTGHVACYLDYQTDMEAVLAALPRLELPGFDAQKPLFLLAHSMGGAIGLRSLHGQHPFRAAAFSAPMWGLAITGWQVPMANLLATVSRNTLLERRRVPGSTRETYTLASPFKDNSLTRDRDMWEYMVRHGRAQPGLTLGGPSIRWVSTAMRETARLQAMAAPDLPCITFLGTSERIVATAPVHDLMGKWTRGTLIEVPGAEHEIMMELPVVRQDFFDRITALFDTNC